MPTATETRLPKQVQAAAEKARQLLDANRAKRDVRPAPDGVAVIENTEVAIPSLNTDTKQGAQPVVPDAVDEAGRDLAYWKHRAQTLDGALKSAKQKHAAIVSDLQTQIATLQGQVRDATESLAASAPIKLEDHFTPEEIEALGATEARILATKLAAATRSAVKATRAELQAAAPSPTVAPPPAPVEDDAANAAFFAELERLVPNWEAINKDKRWLTYCGTKDERTGFTIQELIDAGVARYNAPAVAKVFRDFEKSLKVVDVPAPAEAPAARNAGGREQFPSEPPAPALGKPSKEEVTEHFKNRSLYFHKLEHPKHVSDAAHKAFLARLQKPAA